MNEGGNPVPSHTLLIGSPNRDMTYELSAALQVSWKWMLRTLDTYSGLPVSQFTRIVWDRQSSLDISHSTGIFHEPIDVHPVAQS